MPRAAQQRPRVALVLAGGGARGAYEVGALSVLLPRLERRGERPDVIVGTSVAAINTAYLAATAGDPVDEVARSAKQLWSGIRFDDVLKPLLSPAELSRALTSVGDFLGLPGARLRSLLDPAPLERTLRDRIPFDRIQAGTGAPLRAAAVAATSVSTSRSVVFHDGGGKVARDHVRGIDYVATRLGVQHVRASAAIPTVFPAVEVTTPRRARGWYFDGGTRLNTPIKPALGLGAERVIVIALNSLGAGGERGRPEAIDGASQLVHAVLVDPLVHDVQTLATINEVLGQRSSESAPGRRGTKRVPYILVAPDRRDVIGEIAAHVYKKHYAGLVHAAQAPSLALLGRALDAGSSRLRGELFSYLFFAPEFAEALMKRGQEDAERWLSQRHDDGPWRVRRMRMSG